jgi:hypothetical protein
LQRIKQKGRFAASQYLRLLICSGNCASLPALAPPAAWKDTVAVRPLDMGFGL